MHMMELKMPAAGVIVDSKTKERLAVYALNLSDEWEAKKNQTKHVLGCKA